MRAFDPVDVAVAPTGVEVKRSRWLPVLGVVVMAVASGLAIMVGMKLGDKAAAAVDVPVPISETEPMISTTISVPTRPVKPPARPAVPDYRERCPACQSWAVIAGITADAFVQGADGLAYMAQGRILYACQKRHVFYLPINLAPPAAATVLQ